MPKTDRYEGPVCFKDGWHWSVIQDDQGHDVPHRRLVLEDGGYRFATDDDTRSWNQRNTRQLVVVNPE